MRLFAAICYRLLLSCYFPVTYFILIFKYLLYK